MHSAHFHTQNKITLFYNIPLKQKNWQKAIKVLKLLNTEESLY